MLPLVSLSLKTGNLAKQWALDLSIGNTVCLLAHLSATNYNILAQEH